MTKPNGKDGIRFGPPDRGKGADSRPSAGRMCTSLGCSTILSTYNSSETCWLHSGAEYRHPLQRS